MEILVIDDDRALCRTLEVQLAVQGHETRTAQTAEEGLAIASGWKPPVVFLDVHLPGASGIDVLPKILESSPTSTVIVVTGDPQNVIAGEAMAGGAFEYLRKPFDLDELTSLLARIENERSSAGTAPHWWDAGELETFVGSGKDLVSLHKRIGLLARSSVPVLITGESGTGKEIAARLLHSLWARNENFVALNCSAIVPTLMESDLFGHEKGAFTGAETAKKGKLEHAGGGTIFFDEIGDLPLEMQAKLLRVIQEEEFVPVGGLEPVPLKARIVAATHQNLRDLVRAKSFREDLFYRLNVTTLEIKPLRERKEDLPVLTEYLLVRLARRFGRTVDPLDGEIMEMIENYDWPGNVRELENLLTRAIALTAGTRVTRMEFAAYFGKREEDAETRGGDTTLADAERSHIKKALERFDWNIARTARTLDISPTTLRKKISDFGLVRENRSRGR